MRYIKKESVRRFEIGRDKAQKKPRRGLYGNECVACREENDDDDGGAEEEEEEVDDGRFSARSAWKFASSSRQIFAEQRFN